jgi:hypothetical protein
VDERPSAVAARPASLLQATAAAGVAVVALILADLAVRFVPFAVIARRIEGPLRQVSPDDPIAVGRVKWAIDAAHRRLPWNVRCLATAIAANRLLARRGIPSELWLGVRNSMPAPIDAHAWLVAGGQVVTGEAEQTTFQPLHALMTRVAER